MINYCLEHFTHWDNYIRFIKSLLVSFEQDTRALFFFSFFHGYALHWVFSDRLEFGVLVFVEGGTPNNPEKNPWSQQLDLGHTGRSWALSPLRHPFSPTGIWWHEALSLPTFPAWIRIRVKLIKQVRLIKTSKCFQFNLGSAKHLQLEEQSYTAKPNLSTKWQKI